MQRDAPFILPERHPVARVIADKWQTWYSAMAAWRAEMQDLRTYLFSTSTATTANDRVGWSNRTVRPKLCQIRDNLHANYTAILIPQDKFFVWEGDNDDSEEKAKRDVIESYMFNKVRHPYFRDTLSRMVYDYIDYGNVYARVEWVDERTTTEDGTSVGYVGPRPVRISPYDIAYDVTATSFYRTPKIIRSVVSLADIAKSVKSGDSIYTEELLKKVREFRINLQGASTKDLDKFIGLTFDGFGTLRQYLDSGMVEILEFYGDLYDMESDELKMNQHIVIADRSFVVKEEVNPSWLGERAIIHVGWRLRNDNLVAQGPLANLVGLQYRLNHLENAKADLFDLYCFPIEVLKGHLNNRPAYGPNARYELDEDSELDFVRPDAQALAIDLQIQALEQTMEEMAGSPREKMGIRSPGEKTMFEVSLLDEAASRIFQNKITHFEENFLEILLQNMLETARRNLVGSDVIRSLDSELDIATFQTITQQDIQGEGTLRPIGARHFAAEARFMQNLAMFMNSAVGQDPQVKVHTSGKAIAKLIQRVLRPPFNIYKDNVRVIEQMETSQLANESAMSLTETQLTPIEEAP